VKRRSGGSFQAPDTCPIATTSGAVMQLTAFEYKLLPTLASLASSVTLEGTYPLTSLKKGARNFSLDKGINYHLQLTNTGGAVLLSGTACASLRGECDRCLGSAELTITGEVQGYLVFATSQQDAANARLDDAEAEFTVVDKDGSVNLAPFIYAAIVYELPQMVLCDPACAGLCPVCGADLNLGPCGCSAPSVAGDHPFAVLKQLL
jgi:uncharacterized protein